MNSFYYPAVDATDIDNDGFLDIVINGAIDADHDADVDTTFNEVYKGNGSQFTSYVDLGLDATHSGDIKFIDYNNDGLADIISSGLNYDMADYKHYRFHNTGSGFVKETDLQGKIFGSMEVFDFNHDGLMDYALNGTEYIDGIGFKNDLDYYQNTGNGFQKFVAWTEGTQNGSFKIVDLNNENLFDLIILGFDVNSNPVFKTYLNNFGTLVLSQTLPAVSSGKLDFADFNADGYQDIAVSGQDENYNSYLAVLMNDGTGQLTIQQISNQDISESSINTGDLNNDGYYDFIVSGNDSNYNAVVKAFIYDPVNHLFIENSTTGLYNLGGPGFVYLLDYNNDHHLDVLLSGFDWADPGMPSLTR